MQRISKQSDPGWSRIRYAGMSAQTHRIAFSKRPAVTRSASPDPALSQSGPPQLSAERADLSVQVDVSGAAPAAEGDSAPLHYNSTVAAPPMPATQHQLYRLWIDGVGCWRIWLGECLVIGGGTNAMHAAQDLVLQAPLSRKQALLLRAAEDFEVLPIQTTRLNGEQLTARRYLPAPAELGLGDQVKLKVEAPHPLSRSLRVSSGSAHRFADHAAGWILLADHLLIGPEPINHIVAPHWAQSLVLFRRQGGLWCRPQVELRLNSALFFEPTPLHHDSRLTAPGVSIRVEAM